MGLCCTEADGAGLLARAALRTTEAGEELKFDYTLSDQERSALEVRLAGLT